MSFTVYTIEMAYAHMRSLQELADGSRAHQKPAAHAHRAPRAGLFPRRAPKKR
ncbi:hypothetical protein [Streptomyces sp. NPDC051569]|uniref:hypothetical protein n=1 Tax=Streptomyces sp. NPDC051569 TaxID=3365661 RepID=UPI0037A51BC7